VTFSRPSTAYPWQSKNTVAPKGGDSLSLQWLISPERVESTVWVPEG